MVRKEGVGGMGVEGEGGGRVGSGVSGEVWWEVGEREGEKAEGGGSEGV